MSARAEKKTSRRDMSASQRYFQGVARARYTMRKVTRVVDEQARRNGIEPLEHQALIQIHGADGGETMVNVVADQLDVAPAFASRVVDKLVKSGLVDRAQSDADRRVKRLWATPEGIILLERIDKDVQLHLAYFQHSLTPEQRQSALGIFGFYVGCQPGDVVPPPGLQSTGT